MKKGSSKTNLYLRRTLSKTTEDKFQRSIAQQLDNQNNENIFHNRNTSATAKKRTLERDHIKYSNARTDTNSDIQSSQTKTKIQIKNTALPKTIRKQNLN